MMRARRADCTSACVIFPFAQRVRMFPDAIYAQHQEALQFKIYAPRAFTKRLGADCFVIFLALREFSILIYSESSCTRRSGFSSRPKPANMSLICLADLWVFI
jgi:hypothetical protein